MTDIKDIQQRAAGYYDAYLADLERIVNIDSGTFDRDGVNEAGQFLQDILTDLGFEITLHPNTELGDNFVATLKGNGTRKLMLLGHFDTVYPAGTTTERPFTIRDGKAYGPASMDMKGGMVLACYALKILRDLGFEDFAEITFVANADEEIGSPSSRKLIESEASRMDAVFVFEPGRAAGGVLATRKGVGMFELAVHGVAAHAGASPQDGRSANLEMAHKIIKLHDLNDFEIGTTVSANQMHGGERRNVIADYAHCGVDVRVVTGDEGDRVTQAINEIAEGQVVPDTRTVLTGGINRPPMEKVPGTEALLGLSKTIVDGLGREYVELNSGGGSDGNFTAAVGTPTLDGLGPEGQNAHNAETEYVVLDSITDRIALTTALLIDCPAKP
ncbi:MAG: M20 family peptidase [Sphaerobacteraceae bacterium]|nr:MAG: M20 family peptidase [Sphaerobacteraceae bacterium]